MDFLAKRSSALLDRESAFVQSLTAAALIYTVAKNCSRGDIKECGCNHYQKLRHDNDEWTARPDCSDQVDFSEQMTRSLFEQTGATRLDAQAYAIIHNNRAARIVSLCYYYVVIFLLTRDDLLKLILINLSEGILFKS